MDPDERVVRNHMRKDAYAGQCARVVDASSPDFAPQLFFTSRAQYYAG